MRDKNGKKIKDYTKDNKPIIGKDSKGKPKIGETGTTASGEPILGFDKDQKAILGYVPIGKPIFGYEKATDGLKKPKD